MTGKTVTTDRHRGRSGLLPWVQTAGLAILLALGGCNKSPTMMPMAAPAAVPPPPPSGGVAARNAKLAYTHDLELEMPAASVRPRYDRAIDRCLHDAALDCVVLRASFGTGDQADQPRPGGTLTVRLPHAAVAPFEKDLLAPLPGEATGDAILRSSSTAADDLTGVIEDAEQRQAQLTDYRDRLTELAKHPDVTVEDLIKIESELSNVQSQIEALAAQKKALDQRVDTESLSVAFASRETLEGIADPIRKSWRDASRVLGESTATAISFVVTALPWLPIVALGLFLVRLMFRRWRR